MPRASTVRSTASSAPPDAPAPQKRAYTMGRRAASAEATQERILDAATELFLAESYDRVSLEDIAERARVSLPTVLRKFGAKDALLVACARERRGREMEKRTVAPGDVRGAVRVLASRYEALLPMWTRYLGLEERYPAVAEALGEVRRG